jgi:16S rRNA (uracil1498-N3)-methyltransferase
MTHRYYSAEPIGTDRVALQGSEAHHLLHVLRATPGVHVVLFDGSGWEFDAEVMVCGRATAELAVQDRRRVDRELAFPLTLGVPLPKGDRQRWIVEKAVELGVTRLVPLRTARSIVAGDRASGKLERYVIEASKQCGRNRLMEIGKETPWEEWLAWPVEAPARRWVADPTGREIACADAPSAQPAFAAIGPEGGLAEEEIAAARTAGWEIISLGARILRIETAAVALAAILGQGRVG